MKVFWVVWLWRHFGEYGYSNGVLKGAIGTFAVLLTGVLVWCTLHRWPRVAVGVAGGVCVLGVGWLAVN